MPHPVICPVCRVKFDRDKVPCVKVGRRYGHVTCYTADGKPIESIEKTAEAFMTEKQLEAKERLHFTDYIKEKYGDKANWALIGKQMKEYHDNEDPEKAMSYPKMEKILRYFYDIQNGNIDDTNGGIGIIEYAEKPAKDYYESVYYASQRANKLIEPKVKEIKIKPPRANLKKHYFDFLEDDIDGEE